jgi:hypothetical protein
MTIAAVLALAPATAFAQAAAPSDPGQVGAPAPAGPAAPQAKPSGHVASVSDAAAEDSVQDDGPVRDNRVHGEVSVGVGTNGYRQVSGVATAPIGDIGQATIAIGSEQYNYHR